MEDIELRASADNATSVLHNPSFNLAFERMNTQILEQIVATPLEASEERERLYTMFKSGQLFVQQFAQMINEFELHQSREGDYNE